MIPAISFCAGALFCFLIFKATEEAQEAKRLLHADLVRQLTSRKWSLAFTDQENTGPTGITRRGSFYCVYDRNFKVLAQSDRWELAIQEALAKER
jgi:hypothetical protein